MKKNRTVTWSCVICGKEQTKAMRARAGYEPKLCSRKCIGEFNRRRITGTRDESKWEKFECKQCGKEGERLKNGKRGIPKLFCDRSCASRWNFVHGVKDALYTSKSFAVILRDGSKMLVKSRWEAAFIKDYLEKRGLKWSYEPKRFELDDGDGYWPDFYLQDTNTWVEVKGCSYYDPANKVERFRKLYLQERLELADGPALQERYGLDLSQRRLKKVAEAV